MKKSKYIIPIIVILIIIIFYCIHQNIYITKAKDYTEIDAIGIIDDALCSEPGEKVVYEGNINNDDNSHGKELLDCLNLLGYNNDIYYYSAEKNEKINSSSIIEGLEWMKANGIKRVNISLSSKKKDDNLEEWIENNSSMLIFCSYNNEINTYDYPAMFSGTISSGSNNDINYKSSDFSYRTSNIIIMNKGFHFYKGNSFLSVITMLNYEEK